MSDWKNKILNHESTPPGSVWDSISKKMDEEENFHLPEYAARLYEFESTPPVAAWDNIVAELDREVAPTTQKQKNTKVIILYRRMAVAASLLIVATTLFLLNNKKNVSDNKEGIVVASNEPHNDRPVVTPTQPGITPAPQAPVNNTTTANINTPGRTTTVNNHPAVDKDLAAIDYATTEQAAPTENPFANNAEKIRNSNGDVIMDLDKLGAPNTYVVALGPDGQERRVSTKLAAYIGYLNDKTPDTEEYLDKIIKESSVWKARLKQWSDKLIKTDVSPSFNNYLDVFELSSLLDEKK